MGHCDVLGLAYSHNSGSGSAAWTLVGSPDGCSATKVGAGARRGWVRMSHCSGHSRWVGLAGKSKLGLKGVRSVVRSHSSSLLCFVCCSPAVQWM